MPNCTNCGTHVSPSAVGYFYGEPGPPSARPFCYSCCSLADALAIGNPATKQIQLYVQDGRIVNWPGAVLGTITRETRSRSFRAFQPVRYQAVMLDGSRWYGTGPSDNGNYVRLRRYAK